MILNYCDDKLVTIITLTRNRARLLARAIKSILSQSYKNFEYIIIDGASSDNTDKVVHQFNDPRIKYLRLADNWPVPESIYYGFKKSCGQYITFLDDDDEYLPQKVEKQLALINSLPQSYGFVYCWMDYFDDKSGKKIREWHPTVRGNAYYHQIERQSVGGTPTLLIRSDAFQQIGGWNKGLRHITDWELSTRLSRYYFTDFVPEVLVHVHTNHGYERMQEKNETDERIAAKIEFHEYFFREFADGFEKYPSKKKHHLKALSYMYLKKKQYSRGFDYFDQFIKAKPNLLELFRAIGRINKIIIHNIFSK